MMLKKKPDAKSSSGINIPKRAKPWLTAVFMLAVSGLSGIVYILITSSNVAPIVSLFCAAVLCLLPAGAVKLFGYFIAVDSREALTLWAVIGYVLSLHFVFAYYVSHDYELSVYRYMKVTKADLYYFGGYDEFKADYSGAEDFIYQMNRAPASIVLEGMDESKLLRLSSDDLKQINNESLWDYCGYSEILGTTASEVEHSINTAREMNAYEFTFDYRDLKAKTFGYLLLRPKLLTAEVSDIARHGSHSIRLSTLVMFIAAQLVLTLFIGMHFDVNEDKQVILVYETGKMQAVHDRLKSLIEKMKRKPDKPVEENKDEKKPEDM